MVETNKKKIILKLTYISYLFNFPSIKIII